MYNTLLSRVRLNGIALVKLVINNIDETQKNWCFLLGYYVAAGIPIEIDVIDLKGSDKWSARIGCHSDNLGVRSVYDFLDYVLR